uniref:Uncharacterized protein n=1 Tax=Pseudomonas putida (strain W619) TaxID=390235 RepID=B1J8N2_PSEPW
MNRPICLGDPTSSGGSALSCQLAGTHTVNGKTPAVLGDNDTDRSAVDGQMLRG